MKQSKLFIPTLKEDSAKAVAVSHNLMLRAGYIYQSAAGIYTYLPLANKIIANISSIVEEELEKNGVNRVTFPKLEPSELWEESGRLDTYGDGLFRVTDRHDRLYALAPTHEEVATDVVRGFLNSYKKYPVNLFQIATKMRDERRPRFGLLRGREFVMMDAYSFDTTEEKLLDTYNMYYNAYVDIFNRIGIDFKVVDADNGTMGGKKSNEFMALAPIGEDIIVYEEENEVAYNIEIASTLKPNKNNDIEKNLEEVSTPEITKIEDISKKLEYGLENIVKSVYYKNTDGEVIICFVAGNYEINEIKVMNLTKSSDLFALNDTEINQLGLVKGFVGPVDLDVDAKIFYDHSIYSITNGVCGANNTDKHYINFSFDRDLKCAETVDIRNITEGEISRIGGTPVKFTQGIEIGHIFALGQRYTKSMNMTFLDENQKQQNPYMGSYGIGVSRLLSAIIEQNNDENGIILPKSITPFDVHVLVLDYTKNEEQRKFADELVQKLESKNIRVLLDDRNERPGVKFKEADLIGIPQHIIVGRGFVENNVEYKVRKSNEKSIIDINEIIDVVSKEMSK